MLRKLSVPAVSQPTISDALQLPTAERLTLHLDLLPLFADAQYPAPELYSKRWLRRRESVIRKTNENTALPHRRIADNDVFEDAACEYMRG